MIEQFFDTMIVASSDNKWIQWPIKILVLETVLSHLNRVSSCLENPEFLTSDFKALKVICRKNKARDWYIYP